MLVFTNVKSEKFTTFLETYLEQFNEGFVRNCRVSHTVVYAKVGVFRKMSDSMFGR